MSRVRCADRDRDYWPVGPVSPFGRSAFQFSFQGGFGTSIAKKMDQMYGKNTQYGCASMPNIKSWNLYPGSLQLDGTWIALLNIRNVINLEFHYIEEARHSSTFRCMRIGPSGNI